jgi:molybdopterin-guanine dinucleotide biosynthesis protein A
VTASRVKPAYPVAGFVLAGGRSSRMGREKALLELGGLPLVVRAVQALQSLTELVNVVGPAGAYRELHLSVVADEYPDAGPLGGIATALAHASRPWSLVIACDMPYLSAAWLEFLIGRALASSADVVLPESAYTGKPLPEPLCALYHQRAGAPIRAALERGVRSVMGGLSGLEIERVPPADSKPFDTAGLLFQNLNSMPDYEAARARLEEIEKD